MADNPIGLNLVTLKDGLEAGALLQNLDRVRRASDSVRSPGEDE